MTSAEVESRDAEARAPTAAAIWAEMREALDYQVQQ
jgi:hypothetical protein